MLKPEPRELRGSVHTLPSAYRQLPGPWGSLRRPSTRSPAPSGRASQGASPAPPGELGLKPEPNGDATDAARYVCEVVARGKEEHIAPETRAARDCSVPTGEGGIHLRGYGYAGFLFFLASWRDLREKRKCQQGRDWHATGA